MVDRTNPRKVGRTADMTYVSIPAAFLNELSIEQGDEVVLEAREDGFRARKVTYEVADS